MDSTELMRELNSSIDMLMDSENYLLALSESMNQVPCFLFHAGIHKRILSLPVIHGQELHHVSTVEAAVTARLGEILYERENAQEAKAACQECEAASEAMGAISAAPSKEALALEAVLKKARCTPMALEAPGRARSKLIAERAAGGGGQPESAREARGRRFGSLLGLSSSRT
jgi:hypothetical protein